VASVLHVYHLLMSTTSGHGVGTLLHSRCQQNSDCSAMIKLLAREPTQPSLGHDAVLMAAIGTFTAGLTQLLPALRWSLWFPCAWTSTLSSLQSSA
jgi:hypothetical protein